MEERPIPNKRKFLQTLKSINVIGGLLSKTDKFKIGASALLLLISSMLEVAAISTMYPFLVFAFGNKSELADIPFIDFETLIAVSDGSLWKLSVVYISFILGSLVARIYILRTTGLYIAIASNNLAVLIFERTIFSESERLSSQEVISNILLRCNYAMGVFINITTIFSALILIIGVVYTLLSVNPMVTFLGSGSVAICYFLITKATSKRSLKNGVLIDNKSVSQLKHANQCLGDSKGIIIEGRVKNEMQRFKETDFQIRRSRLSNFLINSIPRSVIESLIVTTIIIVVFSSASQGIKVEDFLPVVGLFALAFQKLLPSVNSLFVNYTNILQSTESIDQLANQIRGFAVNGSTEQRHFHFETLQLNNVTNTDVDKGEELYEPVNLTVRRGEKILIRGKSGVGKSTFLESIIGLKTFSGGELVVNGLARVRDNPRAWWSCLTYIPQAGYVYEGSIFHNITLMEPNDVFDSEKYEKAVKIARLPYPLDPQIHQQTTIKENGQDLSGGERQRLLLARALYGVKDVLLLDEALSALDANLRSDILRDITEQLTDVTILYISHNTSDRQIFTREVVLER